MRALADRGALKGLQQAGAGNTALSKILSFESKHPAAGFEGKDPSDPIPLTSMTHVETTIDARIRQRARTGNERVRLQRVLRESGPKK